MNLPDGYLLSQMDDGCGKTDVCWQSASPPKYRPAGKATPAGSSGASGTDRSDTTRAGGAVVNQLLLLGRSNAASVRQARMWSRKCEQLDTWIAPDTAAGPVGEDENGTRTRDGSGVGKGGSVADGGSRRPGAHHFREPHFALNDVTPSPNTAAAALLAEVREMSWGTGGVERGDGEDAGLRTESVDGTPVWRIRRMTSDAPPGCAGGRTPGSAVSSRLSAGANPMATPGGILDLLTNIEGRIESGQVGGGGGGRGDKNIGNSVGNEAPAAVGAKVAPETVTVGRDDQILRGVGSTPSMGALTNGQKDLAEPRPRDAAAVAAVGTSEPSHADSAGPGVKPLTGNASGGAGAGASSFQCDWGIDGEGVFDDGFDLAAAADAAEREHNVLRTAAAAAAGDALRKASGDVPAAAVDTGAARAASERDAQVEAEGASLGAWRVQAVENRGDHLEVIARVCGGSGGGIECGGNGPQSRRVLRLHDMWADSSIVPGDLVRLVVPSTAQPIKGSDRAGGDGTSSGSLIDVTSASGHLLVLHPGVLVNSTAVGSSLKCLRRTVLQTLVSDQGVGEHSQAAMLGTLSHELSEASLFAAAFNTGPGAKGFFKHSAELVEASSERLFGAGVTEKEALDRLRYVGPGVHKWTRQLVMQRPPSAAPAPSAKQPAGVECTVMNGPGGQVRGTVSVVKMVDAEETVWAPHLGLRGVVDAVAVGKLNEPPTRPGEARGAVSTGMIPVELKTGYWRDPVEHGAQLTLYTLMLGERYKQRVPWGLLHYTRHPGGGERQKKDDETMAIRPGTTDLAFLMHRRNAIAGALSTNRVRLSSNEGMMGRPNDLKGVPFAGGTLPPIEQCRSECDRCFVKETCMVVNAALEGGSASMADEGLVGLSREVTGHLTPLLTTELSKWLRLIDTEASASFHRRATPWVPVVDVRRRGGLAADGFTLRHVPFDNTVPTTTRHRYTLTLLGRGSRSSQGEDQRHQSGGRAAQHADETQESLMSALRPGDRLVLSRQGGDIVVGRVQLKSVTEGGAADSVTLEVDMDRMVRMTGPGAATASELWRIDRDEGSMSGRLRASIIAAFASKEPRAEALRRRVFALDPPPIFDHEAAASAMTSLSPGAMAALDGLNGEQRAAVKHVLAAQDYAVVRGLPGAGKSATLAALVRVLVDMGKSVLVTSHTHSAVDNILQRLPAVGVDDFVRVGGEGGKASPAVEAHMPGGEHHAARTTAELARLANSARVVGATCYAVANNPLISRRESRGKGTGADGFFDVVLVDEAGQMTLPASLAPLMRAAVYVLVGDPHQLPPLVASAAAAEGGLGESILQRLADAHPASVAELNTQYRMADDVARISNVISYENRLRPATREVAQRMLSLPVPPPQTMPEWLCEATDPARRVVMLDTTDLGPAAFERDDRMGAKHTNGRERGIVLDVLRGLVARGANPGEMAVLSPYNAQVDALAADLVSTREEGACRVDLSEVEALTIDRAQGRDVETIVISLVRANPGRETGSLLRDRRRMNVALTRARSKMIIVGCGATLRTSPVMAEILGVLVVEGWMVPLAPPTGSRVAREGDANVEVTQDRR